jgi:hypothetical protein
MASWPFVHFYKCQSCGCHLVVVPRTEEFNLFPLFSRRLLEVNTEKLKMSLQLMESRAMNMSESTNLDNLFEDIHWVILIAGHILCMDSDGETPMIPSEMMQYSIDQLRQGNTSLESSLNVLAAAHQINSVPSDIDRCDHIVRIVSDILKLCVVENSAAEAKLGHFMSPEVSSTIMWFLKRWCLSYLLPVENYYQEVSRASGGARGRVVVLGQSHFGRCRGERHGRGDFRGEFYPGQDLLQHLSFPLGTDSAEGHGGSAHGPRLHQAEAVSKSVVVKFDR